MILVSAERLAAFCEAAFAKAGVPAASARTVSSNLVFANLRGVDSHGVIRLRVYLDRIKKGGFNPGSTPQTINEADSTVLLDGAAGLGAVTGTFAMELAIEKAAKTGLGTVAVRNSNHFGSAAFYALQAVGHGMIGFAATNAGPTMAPTGGREARLGNNAMALAVPAGRHPPIVLDMATGAVAWGKIFLAQQEKRKIPSTWALDESGMPTDDPNAAAHRGFIQPFGGYKGYGLSLVLDILTGVLSGGAFSKQVRTLYQNLEQPSWVAHTCAAARVDAFLPLEEFKQRMDMMIELMHSCPPAAGVERVFVPGQIEHETERRRKAEGIPLSEELLKELREIAAEFRVEGVEEDGKAGH